MWFWDTNGSPNLSQTTKPRDTQQKKRNSWIVVFAVHADHKIKWEIVKNKKISTLILLENWKNYGTWKWRWYQEELVRLVHTKGLIMRLEALETRGRVETIQTTAILRSPRLLRRALETWGKLLSFKHQWKTIGWCEKLKGIIIMITIMVIIFSTEECDARNSLDF